MEKFQMGINKERGSSTKGNILKLLVILILMVMMLSIVQCLLMYMHCTVGKQDVGMIHHEDKHFPQKSERLLTMPPTTAESTLSMTSTTTTFTQSSTTEEPASNQAERLQHLRDYCRSNQSKLQLKQSHAMATQLFYSDNQKIIYCSVPKVACTNWKRLLQVFDGRMKSLFDVKDKNKVHLMKYNTFVGLNVSERNWRQNSYYSFMFVRHPFERLFSAYRNKLMQPNSPQFQRRYGSVILKLFRKNLTQAQYKEGKNVTFEEFLKYIVVIHRRHGYKKFDEHWQIMTKLCSPCTMKYDFIGKMETLHSDAKGVLKQIRLNEKYDFPTNATDNYKHKASTLMKSYFAGIPKPVLEMVRTIYKDDFEAFGYSKDGFL